MPQPRRLRASAARLLLACLALLGCFSCHTEGTPPAQENWVSVKLNDSLSKYSAVDVLILSASDTSQVLGKAWSGRLENPSDLPPFRIQDGGAPAVVVRVKGYDDSGKLVLDQLIAKEGGRQVITDILPVPVTPGKVHPSVRLASLAISPGTLLPAFDSLVDDYQVNFTHNQTSIILTPVPVCDSAEIRVEGVLQPKGMSTNPMELHVGQNEISIRVTVGDSTGRYSVKVDRAGSPIDTTNPTDPEMIAWKYKTTVNFNVPYLGIGSGQVLQFPLLVRLDKENFNFSQARSKGQDLRFARFGKLLDHEIGRWDTAAEVAEVWVRLDTVRLDAGFAPLNMYWGNAAATNTSDGAKVFHPSGGHGAVWHLGESGRGDPNEYKDATGRYHGSGGGTTRKGPRRTPGVVGFGQNFRFGGTPGTIEVPGSFDPGPQWSMQFWIKSEGNTKGVIFQKGNSWNESDMRFQLTVQDGAGQKLAIHRAGGGSHHTEIYIPDQFIFVGITYDGDKLTYYVDGFMREMIMPWKQGSNPGGMVLMGAYNQQGTELAFNGSLDEMWVANAPRSAAWMRLAYENQRPFSYLVTVGSIDAGRVDPLKIPDLPGIPTTPGLLDSLLKNLIP